MNYNLDKPSTLCEPTFIILKRMSNGVERRRECRDAVRAESLAVVVVGGGQLWGERGARPHVELGWGWQNM